MTQPGTDWPVTSQDEDDARVRAGTCPICDRELEAHDEDTARWCLRAFVARTRRRRDRGELA